MLVNLSEVTSALWDIYGPFHTRNSVYLPHSAEVTSDKFTNMRYSDKSSAKHNLDNFLKTAYSKQIKELNGTTVLVANMRIRGMKNNTELTPTRTSKLIRDHYVKQIQKIA